MDIRPCHLDSIVYNVKRDNLLTTKNLALNTPNASKNAKIAPNKQMMINEGRSGSILYLFLASRSNSGISTRVDWAGEQELL